MIHQSVLLNEVLAQAERLTKSGARFWDGTLGAGGHCSALATKYPNAQGYASDTDDEMLRLASASLAGRAIQIKHANFSENPFAGVGKFDFILLDLGISSAHFDVFERGFSYRYDQPLDMRLDTENQNTAADILNNQSEREISTILFRFGEERRSRQIAARIVAERKKQPILRTGQLVEICKYCYPLKSRGQGHADRHPYVRTFQALRIAVNAELESLEQALAFLPDLLTVDGKLCIITFHSLEDRLVKQAFRGREQIKNTDPLAKSHFVRGNFVAEPSKGIVPSPEEIQHNSRARSARMRVLRRLA